MKSSGAGDSKMLADWRRIICKLSEGWMDLVFLAKDTGTKFVRSEFCTCLST
jgi:hypothetical protein